VSAEGGAEGAGQVGAALGPIQAGPGDRAAGREQRSDVERQVVGQPGDAYAGQAEAGPRLDDAGFDEGFGKPYAEAAGEVVVASAGLLHGR
jgi:hypothetical protein